MASAGTGSYDPNFAIVAGKRFQHVSAPSQSPSTVLSEHRPPRAPWLYLHSACLTEAAELSGQTVR
jgi:hypothetical protein